MNIAWLGGWAIPKNRVLNSARTHYPKAEHHVLYPGKYWKNHLPESADLYVGHSFGAFLLLTNGDVLPKASKVALLAPFLDIKSESGLGGRVSVTQLKMLKRTMKQNASLALDDFYTRAGLRVRCQGELPYSETDLFWGIDQLIDARVPQGASTLNKGAFEASWKDATCPRSWCPVPLPSPSSQRSPASSI